MEEDDDTIVTCASLIIASVGAAATISTLAYSEKRKHQVWIRRYIKHREQFGAYNALLPELSDSAKFHAYLRMDKDTFEKSTIVYYSKSTVGFSLKYFL